MALYHYQQKTFGQKPKVWRRKQEEGNTSGPDVAEPQKEASGQAEAESGPNPAASAANTNAAPKSHEALHELPIEEKIIHMGLLFEKTLQNQSERNNATFKLLLEIINDLKTRLETQERLVQHLSGELARQQHTVNANQVALKNNEKRCEPEAKQNMDSNPNGGAFFPGMDARGNMAAFCVTPDSGMKDVGRVKAPVMAANKHARGLMDAGCLPKTDMNFGCSVPMPVGLRQGHSVEPDQTFMDGAGGFELRMPCGAGANQWLAEVPNDGIKTPDHFDYNPGIENMAETLVQALGCLPPHPSLGSQARPSNSNCGGQDFHASMRED